MKRKINVYHPDHPHYVHRNTTATVRPARRAKISGAAKQGVATQSNDADRNDSNGPKSDSGKPATKA